jgi:hypothetical protein
MWPAWDSAATNVWHVTKNASVAATIQGHANPLAFVKVGNMKPRSPVVCHKCLR